MHRVRSWTLGQYRRLWGNVDDDDDDDLILPPTNNPWPGLNRLRSASAPAADKAYMETRARHSRTNAVDLTVRGLAGPTRNPGMDFIQSQGLERPTPIVNPISITRRSSADGAQEALQDSYLHLDIEIPLATDDDHRARMAEQRRQSIDSLPPFDLALDPFSDDFEDTAFQRYIQRRIRKPTDELGQVRVNQAVIAAAQHMAPESSAQAIKMLEEQNEAMIPGTGKIMTEDARKDSKFDTDTDYSVAGPWDLTEASTAASLTDFAAPPRLAVEVIGSEGGPAEECLQTAMEEAVIDEDGIQRWLRHGDEPELL